MSHRSAIHVSLMLLAGFAFFSPGANGSEFQLELREQRERPDATGTFDRTVRKETWQAKRTAVIVCDVWDLHHCQNAVRRMDEFLPRLNQLLTEARNRGALIIHAPSDCMDAYADHPARRRASAAKQATRQPADVAFWCSRIPTEERAAYPIDQSDGGEDDDPTEHAAWAAKLKQLGRNPGMPWKKQSDQITIDAERDYISDRGGEVWNILEHHGIDHVILTGVHTNMCVLGRPFGLRQMAVNGKRVVLMRDLTDCMYNPKRWPYVDHFTGNDLVVSHIERFVCPTITSDQVLGGQPFRFKSDARPQRDVMSVSVPQKNVPDKVSDRSNLEKHWTIGSLPATWEALTGGVVKDHSGAAWYRCAIRLSKSWVANNELTLSMPQSTNAIQVWCNGQLLELLKNAGDGKRVWRFPASSWVVDDTNLLVMRVEHRGGDGGLRELPSLHAGKQDFALKGRWQFRIGDDPAWSNMPLPAKFGIGTDMLFEPLAFHGADRKTLSVPFVALDLKQGETQEAVLSDGRKVLVKLLELSEARDEVRGAVRRAEVKVQVDDQQVTLFSANYRLPTRVAGVRIDCPITGGYTRSSSQTPGGRGPWGLDKDARIRIWPGEGALIDPETFGYPARQRWFASATQMANEPVYVDGGEKPSQGPVYYHYGLDIGGAEGMVDVIAATDGLVVSVGKNVLPGHKDTPVAPRYDVVYLLDDRGWYYRYSHLLTIASELKPGVRVRRGDAIGVLGKEGGSGGWSHLHFDISGRQPSGKWGIIDGYVFLWDAYLREHRPEILAVARPHHFALTGEKVALDGSRSWSAAGAIQEFAWTCTDGQKSSYSVFERTYDKPGVYCETLKITDAQGRIDYDFAIVHVLDKSNPGQLPPSIHASYSPTFGIRPGQPIKFLVRTFRTTDGEETWDFGDGSKPIHVKSDGNVTPLAKDGYAITTHSYERPGIYIATVQRTNRNGHSATARVKVIVEPR